MAGIVNKVYYKVHEKNITLYLMGQKPIQKSKK